MFSFLSILAKIHVSHHFLGDRLQPCPAVADRKKYKFSCFRLIIIAIKANNIGTEVVWALYRYDISQRLLLTKSSFVEPRTELFQNMESKNFFSVWAWKTNGIYFYLPCCMGLVYLNSSPSLAVSLESRVVDLHFCCTFVLYLPTIAISNLLTVVRQSDVCISLYSVADCLS